jgi:branched-chain amino acid transport system permease protein
MSQAIVNGILLGGVYTCVGVGFSLLYGVMNVLNLAHGAFGMLGGYVTYWMFTLTGLDPFVSLPVSMAALFALGYLLQRYVLSRLSGANVFMLMLLTFGLSLILANVALSLWSADPRGIRQSYAGSSFDIGSIAIPYVRLAVFVIGLALTGALALFMNRTRTGQAIQATALDRYAADLVGINARAIFAITFGISAALAGAAGSLIAMTSPIDPQMGTDLTIKAFIVAVLGGLGGVYGALVGGIVLGVAELAGAQLFGLSYQTAIGLGLLMIILAVRPQGLVGKQFFAEVKAAD